MYSFIINCFNAIIKGLAVVLGFIFSLLPDCPFEKYILENDAIKKFIGYINYFLPISEVLVVMEAWVVAIGIYYVYQCVLRWIKYIE